MARVQPVEFVRRLASGVLQRVGNRVALTGSVGGVEIELPADEITGALIVIRVPHHEVHEGEMFRAFVTNLALADDGKIGILLDTSTATRFGHLTYVVSGGGDYEFRLRRSPTVTIPGAALAEINVHDASTKIAEVVATGNPTVTDGTGTELDHFLAPGGSGGNASGSTAGRDEEKCIMRTGGATYYLEMFNRAGNAQIASLTALWYEESTQGG